VGVNTGFSRGVIRANVDKDLAENKENQDGRVFLFVEVVEGAVFAECVAESEEDTTKWVKPEESKAFV
jgi:hypothetical protein